MHIDDELKTGIVSSVCADVDTSKTAVSGDAAKNFKNFLINTVKLCLVSMALSCFVQNLVLQGGKIDGKR